MLLGEQLLPPQGFVQRFVQREIEFWNAAHLQLTRDRFLRFPGD